MYDKYQNIYKNIKLKEQLNHSVNESEAGFIGIFEKFLKESNPFYLNLLDSLLNTNQLGTL